MKRRGFLKMLAMAPIAAPATVKALASPAPAESFAAILKRIYPVRSFQIIEDPFCPQGMAYFVGSTVFVHGGKT